jgi:FAD/FMN-containing dehydrogenase/Fe-S oxidoreductase
VNRSVQEKLQRAVSCDVRFDNLTRQLHATDASIHQLVPWAVAFPKTSEEASQLMRAAMELAVPITPRGSGTGLCGGAIGPGLVIDFARHNRAIGALDKETRTVRVGAGVVLDQLNAFLQPHGLCFGPDVATSSRATLGGMIANNSSGARAPYYGATIDHVRSLELILPDGRIVEVGADKLGLAEHQEMLRRLLSTNADEIRERFHDGICKRWPGYGLDRCLRAPGDLSKPIGGSEGTLAAIWSAELSLVTPPTSKGIGLIFFDSVDEAMQATVDLLPLKPAAIEHIDDVCFDQTRGQMPFRAARELLELDTKPCRAILIVEFYSDDRDKLTMLEKMPLGVRKHICKNGAEMATVWNLRKAGLSLLTGRPGPAKPVAGIEDAAIPPARLPEYVQGLRALMKPLGLEASFYGHAASGLLHVRPLIDLHKAEDIAKFRKLTDGVSALVSEFKGSFTAEHGVGISHTEYALEHIGPALLEAMRRIKTIFDPKNVMNPGKIFDTGEYKIDNFLRQGAHSRIPVTFDPVLAFAAKDGSFVGNLEQCNGCGGCRKDAPTMCPTFIATGDEIMSTRGRANTIRAVLEHRIASDINPVLTKELDDAISNCLSCKACTTECPSNVNMALLKAELLFARLKTSGIPLGTRLISRVDLMGALASLTPGLANASLKNTFLRRQMERWLGISAKRPLPEYAAERFDHWFKRRKQLQRKELPSRGRVVLWDDCFVRHHEPQIGQAAVRVLEAAGFEVVLPEGRVCCGRPAFSMGRLDLAARFGRANVAILQNGNEPIVFLEPSCYSMFSEDYRELKVPGAEAVGRRAVLFEQFVEQLLREEPGALRFRPLTGGAAIHAHCHAKALTEVSVMPRLAGRIPDLAVTLLDTGCCGMAGAFGAMAAKYDLSKQVAAGLVGKIEALPPETRVIASGTSCRHQITHLTTARPLHMAELLAEGLEEPSRT